MRTANRCPTLLAVGALALGGCAGLAGPSPVNQSTPLWIDGFPQSGEIRVGQSTLLSLPELPPEVESIRWISSDPAVASLVATPAASPCAEACAWLRGESPGRAQLVVRACYVDGSCVAIVRARICAGPSETREVEAAVSVVG